MSARVTAFLAVLLLVVGASAAYALGERERSQARAEREPAAGRADTAPTGPRIVFRHTGPDAEYGVVASVSLEDPSGPRAFTGVSCDRVDATPEGATCLATERGVVTAFVARDLDRDWRVVAETPLAGIPSRTRRSDDGRLVATTSFVTGHSYATQGFSTATEIRRVGPDGTESSYGNLEGFSLVIGGEAVAPVDRNVWGVTFTAPSASEADFYATVATGGRTYLVRGDLGGRELTAVAADVECPSLSPDGSRIAFKQARTQAGATGWMPAVLDLSTGRRTVLAGEARSIDDQIEWLDEDTLLYGVARGDAPGVTDVWALDVDPTAAPRIAVAEAWSPSVVR